MKTFFGALCLAATLAGAIGFPPQPARAEVVIGKLDGIFAEAVRPCYHYKTSTDRRGCRVVLMSCPSFRGRAIVTAAKSCPPKGGLTSNGRLR